MGSGCDAVGGAVVGDDLTIGDGTVADAPPVTIVADADWFTGDREMITGVGDGVAMLPSSARAGGTGAAPPPHAASSTTMTPSAIGRWRGARAPIVWRTTRGSASVKFDPAGLSGVLFGLVGLAGSDKSRRAGHDFDNREPRLGPLRERSDGVPKPAEPVTLVHDWAE